MQKFFRNNRWMTMDQIKNEGKDKVIVKPVRGKKKKDVTEPEKIEEDLVVSDDEVNDLENN